MVFGGPGLGVNDCFWPSLAGIGVVFEQTFSCVYQVPDGTANVKLYLPVVSFTKSL